MEASGTVYPKGQKHVKEGHVDHTDLRVMLLGDSYTFDDTDEYVADVAGDEHDGSGYSRVCLSNETIGITDDWVYVDAADDSFGSLQAGTNPVRWIVVYQHKTTDSDSILLCAWDLGTGCTPVGNDLSFFWPSTGLYRSKQQ